MSKVKKKKERSRTKNVLIEYFGSPAISWGQTQTRKGAENQRQIGLVAKFVPTPKLEQIESGTSCSPARFPLCFSLSLSLSPFLLPMPFTSDVALGLDAGNAAKAKSLKLDYKILRRCHISAGNCTLRAALQNARHQDCTRIASFQQTDRLVNKIFSPRIRTGNAKD